MYEVLQLKGFSRSEYIFKNDEPHLLEVNTVPGLTKESILPQQAAAADISLEALFENAIEECLRQKVVNYYRYYLLSLNLTWF